VVWRLTASASSEHYQCERSSSGAFLKRSDSGVLLETRRVARHGLELKELGPNAIVHTWIGQHPHT